MSRKYTIFLLFILILASIPFLGLTNFNTKGEPREAVVALSMLQSDNWILPQNNGGEMAYKPPFFHWCIAAFSVITGGNVTEFTARFPSAISAVLMLIACFLFFAKRENYETSFIAALIAFTSFEVHRAVFACRVDMVLTACIVCSLLFLYRWFERGISLNISKIPWIAILLMSFGTLTKGPVAIILPCGVIGLLLLLKGKNFWVVSGKLLLVAILSLFIPVLWYYAAYLQGGDDFLMLVKEENIDRFLGKMSYASHENPWTYNVLMLLLGFLPWTLMLLISLFFADWKGARDIRSYPSKLVRWIKGVDSYKLFALIAAILIFIFYCIPKSKRSVYLLPVYPFISFFIAKLVVWLKSNRPLAIKIYGWIVASLSIIVVGLMLAVKFGLIPDSIFSGRHAAENIAYMNALGSLVWFKLGFALILPLIGCFIWAKFRSVNAILLSMVLLFVSLDSVIQPAILNVKSDKSIAISIAEKYKNENIDSYVSVEMLHYFTINFYNNDRIGVFNPDKATTGVLLIGDRDAESYLPTVNSQFVFELIEDTGKKSCDTGQIIRLYRYKKR